LETCAVNSVLLIAALWKCERFKTKWYFPTQGKTGNCLLCTLLFRGR